MSAAEPLIRATQWPPNPYKGLNFYSAQDAPLFSLRDEDLAICEQLLGSNTTKLLLLHGRTGTGKSSFLRAGLYARALRGNSAFYVVAEGGEPILIRSTSNPIAGINDFLLAKLHDERHFPGIRDTARREAVQLLGTARTEKPAAQARALRTALSALTAKLVGTLVLVIDQAEEIFTLESPAAAEIREAYFEFLDDLCFQRFDIKLIIALRTEYYGQFVDRFRVPPNLTISPVASGLDQFMLHGVQDAERLRAAIELPTLEGPSTSADGSPREVYEFIFETGLAAQIADDLTLHCGESSALPVLQIVCSELFDGLPKKTGSCRQIRLVDYRSLGGVSGAIERYIEKAIEGALKASGTRKTQQRIDGWKHIVSSLVARQEGGALTSLLTRIDVLEQKAREARVYMPVDRCLEALASDKFRLLRLVKIRDPQTRRYVEHYSLAHDALATSLLHWKETRGKQIEDRARILDRARKRLFLWATCAAALLLIAFTFVFILAISVHTLAVQSTLATIQAEPKVTSRLLRLAAFESNSASIWRRVNGTEVDKIVETLRSTLLASPIYIASGPSANVSKSSDRVVSVDKAGQVSLVTLRTGEPVVTSPYQVEPENVLGSGFIDGLTTPVVITRDEHIYWGTGESQPLATVLPGTADLLTWNTAAGDASKPLRFLPTFAAGRLQLSGLTTDYQPVLYTLHYDAASGSLRSGKRVNDLTAQPRTLPTDFSPYTWTGLAVRDAGPSADQPIKLLVSARGDRNVFAEFEIPAPSPLEERLARSAVAFLPDDTGFAFRDTTTRVMFVLTGHAKVPTPAIENHRIIGSGGSLEPLIGPPSSGRPTLAAVRTPSGYRIAWLTSTGVTVMQSNGRGDFEVPGNRPEFAGLLTSAWSLKPESTQQSLWFNDEGGLLTLLLQGERAEVRVWNISDERAGRIGKMTATELIEAACHVAAVSDERESGTQITAAEFDALPVEGRKQPCLPK